MYCRRSVDGRSASKLRSSHSNNPLLARHKRDTLSSTCDPQRHSMTTTPNDADRLYSYAAGADSGGDWSQTIYRGPFSIPATSEPVFPDCAAGTWMSAEPSSSLWDRRCSVVSSDALLARSLRPPRQHSTTQPSTTQAQARNTPFTRSSKH